MAATVKFNVEFIIPINNRRDKHIPLEIEGNSLDEIESTCQTLANDYERKNKDEKDPDKPVRFIIKDGRGNPIISWAKGKWTKLADWMDDKLEDKNDEEGTPKNQVTSGE